MQNEDFDTVLLWKLFIKTAIIQKLLVNIADSLFAPEQNLFMPLDQNVSIACKQYVWLEYPKILA